MSAGTIRVGNKREDAKLEFKPELNEVAVNIDLGNSSLANQYRICASMTRKQAIGFFKVDLHTDVQRHGPMFLEIDRLASLVMEGRNVILMCWCKPLACHGDVVVEEVNKQIQKRQGAAA